MYNTLRYIALKKLFFEILSQTAIRKQKPYYRENPVILIHETCFGRKRTLATILFYETNIVITEVYNVISIETLQKQIKIFFNIVPLR